jgi:hypothetical protein
MSGPAATLAEAGPTLATLLATAPAAPRGQPYRIAGHALVVHHADDALRVALAPALDHLRTTAPGGGPRLDVFVRGGATPSVDPGSATIRPRVHFSDCAVRGVVYPATGIAGLLDAGRGRAVWWLPDAARLPVSERCGPFRTLLQWWLSPGDLQVAHAAAVGDDRGAALLVGRGGSGKSVTAVACAAAGLHFLGDDSVLFAAGPRPMVHCLYGCATVYPHDARRAAGLAVLPGAGDKVALDLRGRVVPSRPIAAVLAPRVTGRPDTRVVPLSPAATLRALAPSSLFNVPGSDGPAFARFVDLARRVPGFALELGTDVERIPGVVAGLIARGSAA